MPDGEPGGDRRYEVDSRYVTDDEFQRYRAELRYELEERTRRWLDAFRSIDAEMQTVKQENVTLRTEVGGLQRRLAAYAGGLAVLVIVFTTLVGPLIVYTLLHSR